MEGKAIHIVLWKQSNFVGQEYLEIIVLKEKYAHYNQVTKFHFIQEKNPKTCELPHFLNKS